MSNSRSEAEPDVSKVDYRLLRRLLAFLAPYRFHIVGGVALTLVSSALGPLRPYLTRIAVDEHIVYRWGLFGVEWRFVDI